MQKKTSWIETANRLVGNTKRQKQSESTESKASKESGSVSEGLEQFGEDTDFHGLKRVFRRDYTLLRRTFWLFFFLAGLTGFIANTVDRLSYYLQYPHSSELDVMYDMELGLKMVIHAQEEPPFVKELGFGVLPGDHHFIAIQKKYVHNLVPPWGNCYDGKLKYYSHYSVPACRIECETDTIVKECGCKLAEMPGNTSVCLGHMYMGCAYPALEEVEHSDLCSCQNPCDMTTYRRDISSRYSISD
ncbi:acid-sensing ion channel 1-like [Lingula anatina]|uniref:Acid-sensing ion channel 1-like n=1 Tax=Lingula anatina TaxID=7574 RepID=A0A2R2MRL3_LINAN|nr:acid-sensing ion channel 1-like [Lingula anatina]|eukprot:XP_023932890.1 acid-sensing ion channel 1-like [Lingula anatina]